MRLYGSLVKDEIGKRWGKSFSAAKPQPLRINSLLSVMGRRILLKQYRNLFTRLLF
jgi:hypothetical protein